MSGARLHRLRLRIGRWLIRPEAERIWAHYTRRSNEAEQAGEHERSANCDYIALGARYVGQRWPHG